MIGIDVVIAEISGLTRQDLERWIANAWVRPDRSADGYAFREIDVARAQQAKQRAEEKLRSQAPDTNYDEGQSALKRAETRLDVAGKGGQ